MRGTNGVAVGVSPGVIPLGGCALTPVLVRLVVAVNSSVPVSVASGVIAATSVAVSVMIGVTVAVGVKVGVGGSVALRVWRNGTERTVNVTVADLGS